MGLGPAGWSASRLTPLLQMLRPLQSVRCIAVGLACCCVYAGMRKRLYEAQVIDFLLEIGAAASLQGLCRKHGFSAASYALLRRSCGRTRMLQARQLRGLEEENRHLKAQLHLQLRERERIRRALLQPL